MASFGRNQRSTKFRLVGVAGHSKRWKEVCVLLSHSGHMALAERPMEWRYDLRRVQ